jgi:hypothetical protein
MLQCDITEIMTNHAYVNVKAALCVAI